MYDLINGVPVHPLVVHAVVVLLPLAILGTVAIAVRPRWRLTHGPLVVGAALVATVLCPVATSSGEELEHRVGNPGKHADLGAGRLAGGLPHGLALRHWPGLGTNTTSALFQVVIVSTVAWFTRQDRRERGLGRGRPD